MFFNQVPAITGNHHMKLTGLQTHLTTCVVDRLCMFGHHDSKVGISDKIAMSTLPSVPVPSCPFKDLCYTMWRTAEDAALYCALRQ